MPLQPNRTNSRSNAWCLALWSGAGLAGAYLGYRAVQNAKIRQENTGLASGKTILILGAGFGGAYAARELARLLPEPDNGRIVLLDRRNYLLFTPMLTEAAGGELDVRHIVSPVRELSSRISYQQGRVDHIDLATKTVTYTVDGDGMPAAQRTLTADQIVLALGSVANYHHISGVEEHSLGMKTLDDAAMVFNRVLAALERATSEPDPEVRRSLLTFIVGGGGFTGVETMAALNDLVRDRAEAEPLLPADEIRTVLIHPDARLLPEITPDLASYAQQKLQERGVEVMLNTKITGAGPDYVEVEGGHRIPTRTLVWTAGVMPNPVIAPLDCPHGKHGGIAVDPTLAVPGHPGIWALGDCAEIPQPGGNGTYAPTAQNATREGSLVAQNIIASLRGQPARPFVYTPLGELALVGRQTGVARIYGLNFSGLAAWFLWRAVYWAKMPDSGQRVRIGIDWALDFLFGRQAVQLPAPVSQTQNPQSVPTPSR